MALMLGQLGFAIQGGIGHQPIGHKAEAVGQFARREHPNGARVHVQQMQVAGHDCIGVCACASASR